MKSECITQPMKDNRSEKQIIGAFIISFSLLLTACGPLGIVTKNGPVVFLDDPYNPGFTYRHEQCHYENAISMGFDEYVEEYTTNYEFRIEEERRCGYPDPENHPIHALFTKTPSAAPLPLVQRREVELAHAPK